MTELDTDAIGERYDPFGIKRVDVADFLEAMRTYYCEYEHKDTIRLGQYLMNELVPKKTNPGIFYEEDDGKSAALFGNAYVAVPLGGEL